MSHKVILQKVRSKNFRSVGASFIEVDLIENPSTLVVSVDNGAGKSTTTISALYYGLFDKAYGEKARKTSLINSKSNKDSLVEVEFEARGKNYLVRRGQKPAVFEVHEEGELWKNDSDNTDNQKRLLEVLGFDHVIFENVIALGRDRFVPFIKMDASTRRHVADEMLSTGIFGSMNEVAKEDMKVLARQVSDVEFEMTAVDQKLSSVTRLVEQHNTNRGDIVTSARERITALEDDLSKKGDVRSRLDAKRQETAEEAAVEADKLSAIQTSIKTVDDQFNANLEETRKGFSDRIQQINLSHQTQLRTLNTDQRTRTEEASARGRAAQDEASSKLTRMRGIKGDLERKASGELSKANSFRSLGDCPTCMQVVPDAHKDRIAGEMETSAAEVNSGLERLAPKLTEAEQAVLDAKKATEDEIAAISKDVSDQTAALEALSGPAVVQGISSEMEGALDSVRVEWKAATAQLEAERVPLKEANMAFVTKLNEFNAAIASLDGQILVLQAEIKTQRDIIERNLDQGADEQLKKLKVEQEELNTQKEALVSKYDALKAEVRNYSDLLIILKDNGVKADVVKQYIPFFNRRVNEILDGMGMYINFVMDEDFNIEMADPTRKNQNLYDLSTGQQRRIDLAILFTWREIASMKSSISCNLLILDEVLENLSQQGVVDFMGMFEAQMANSTNLMVVTQREDEFSEYFEKVIKYQLRDDFTVLLAE